MFSIVLKRRYLERRYETFLKLKLTILKLKNSFVIRREVFLPGMVGKYYGEKKLKRQNHLRIKNKTLGLTRRLWLLKLIFGQFT